MDEQVLHHSVSEFKSNPATLIEALRLLADRPESPSGFARVPMAAAADWIEELEAALFRPASDKKGPHPLDGYVVVKDEIGMDKRIGWDKTYIVFVKFMDQTRGPIGFTDEMPKDAPPQRDRELSSHHRFDHTKLIFDAAREQIRDDGVFSADQIAALHRMLSTIEQAVEQKTDKEDRG